MEYVKKEIGELEYIMEDWKEYKLGEAISFKNGKKRNNTEGCFPIYGGNGILGYSNETNYENCVIIGRVGAYCGSVFYEKSSCWVSDNAISAIPKEGFDTQFCYYLLSQLQLNKRCIGTGQPLLTQEILNRITVTLPPLPTQQKIAQILSSLDDKIELNNKINANLEQQIEALLMDYISSENSTSVKLGDYLYIKGRIGWKGLKKEEYLKESRYRIINGETLTKSGIDWNKAGYISEERYIESPEIMLQVGDILLSKDGTIGKLGYVDTLELPTSVASGIFVIRNNNPEVISTVFIYFLLKSKFFNSFIAARTEGSVIPHLYQKDFMDFEFSLPSAEKMQEFNSITSPMFEQINTNLSENKKLSNLRDTLLPKLMNGEIEV